MSTRNIPQNNSFSRFTYTYFDKLCCLYLYMAYTVYCVASSISAYRFSLDFRNGELRLQYFPSSVKCKLKIFSIHSICKVVMLFNKSHFIPICIPNISQHLFLSQAFSYVSSYLRSKDTPDLNCEKLPGKADRFKSPLYSHYIMSKHF